jgi:hypothetical protein
MLISNITGVSHESGAVILHPRDARQVTAPEEAAKKD